MSDVHTQNITEDSGMGGGLWGGAAAFLTPVTPTLVMPLQPGPKSPARLPKPLSQCVLKNSGPINECVKLEVFWASLLFLDTKLSWPLDCLFTWSGQSCGDASQLAFVLITLNHLLSSANVVSLLVPLTHDP